MDTGRKFFGLPLRVHFGEKGNATFILPTCFLPKTFSERLAEYAYAAQKDKPNLYVNFTCNITRGCDCEGLARKIILPDMGIFAGTDPIAMNRPVRTPLKESWGENISKGAGTHCLTGLHWG
jgi:uncharacterized Fe-S center protein